MWDTRCFMKSECRKRTDICSVSHERAFRQPDPGPFPWKVLIRPQRKRPWHSWVFKQRIRFHFCKGRYSEYCLFFVVNLNVAGNITSSFRRGHWRWRQELRRLFYVFKNCKNSLYIYNKLLFVVIKALEPLCKTVRRSLKTATLVVSLLTFSSRVALSFLFCLYSSFDRQIVGALFFWLKWKQGRVDLI